MFDLDHSEAQSSTATVCEHAALYGATPERGEFDSRDVWDRDDALAALDEAFRIIAQGIVHQTAHSSQTNARACSGASSTCSTPRPGASSVTPTSSSPT